MRFASLPLESPAFRSRRPPANTPTSAGSRRLSEEQARKARHHDSTQCGEHDRYILRREIEKSKIA